MRKGDGYIATFISDAFITDLVGVAITSIGFGLLVSNVCCSSVRVVDMHRSNWRRFQSRKLRALSTRAILNSKCCS
jgi:hypothetical protein